MRTVERDLNRILTLLRNRIREQVFTQLEVQEALGWGRSYISQLLTKQKSLRVEKVLLILHVIHANPEDFWAELYPPELARAGPRGQVRAPAPGDAAMRDAHREMRHLLDGAVRLLKKGVFTGAEIDRAVRRVKNLAMA